MHMGARRRGYIYRKEARSSAGLANEVASGGKSTSSAILGGDTLDAGPVLAASGTAVLAEVETIEEAVNTLVPFLVLGRRVLIGLSSWSGVSTVLLLRRE
jgi:hypothetical protein